MATKELRWDCGNPDCNDCYRRSVRIMTREARREQTWVLSGVILIVAALAGLGLMLFGG